MKGYLSVFIVVCHILTLNQSNSEEIDHNVVKSELKTDVSRRKLPIFPKNTIKFVVTPTLPAKTAYKHKVKGKLMPKLSLIPQTTSKPKAEMFTTTRARKKPLMQLRTYTIQSRSSWKLYETHQYYQNKADVVNGSEFLVGITRKMGPEINRYDTVTEALGPEKSYTEKGILHLLNKKDNGNLRTKQIKVSEQKEDIFLLEEERDRNEFIFLDDGTQQVTDTLDNEYDTDGETTTAYEISEKNKRVKRSGNIIEEENMVSTVSGFKNADRDTRPNNNFYFKNINS